MSKITKTQYRNLIKAINQKTAKLYLGGYMSVQDADKIRLIMHKVSNKLK